MPHGRSTTQGVHVHVVLDLGRINKSRCAIDAFVFNQRDTGIHVNRVISLGGDVFTKSDDSNLKSFGIS
ncbi:unnamed protein product [Victoria cruziana]